MKRKDGVVLALTWALLYIPYILQGGWIRDDLALLTSTRGVQLYAQFQWFVSMNRDMTARPISAILHGLSYWLLGTDAWPYHLVNLALFGASVLFLYLALKRLLSRDVAFVTALLALVYPCASTTVFSSIMMNSNLAAFFWAGGLYVAAGDFRWKRPLTTALFVMSALSYEVFIPLFAFGTLVDIFIFKLRRSDWKRLLMDALPMLVAVGIYAIYRGFLEKAIFHTSFSRIVISSPLVLLDKFLSSLIAGLRIATVEPVVLSFGSLRDLSFMPVGYVGVVVLGLIIVGIYLYKAYVADRAASSAGGTAHGQLSRMGISVLGRASNYLALLGLGASLFGFAHLIYTFSDYVPESIAFNNRTLGGMRFVTAFAVAVLAVPLYRGLAGRQISRMAALFLIGVFSLFTVATIGQSEAWVLAGRWNEQTAIDITQAIRARQIDRTKPLTLVAVLPTGFPGQINQEPILGVPWDITPLLSLHNPDLIISANVYNRTALAGPEGVTIQNYDHSWQGAYPLWLYGAEGKVVYPVASEQDWNSYLKLAASGTDP